MSDSAHELLLPWIEELLLAQSLSALTDAAVGAPAPGDDPLVAALVLADPRQELRLLAFGTEAPAQPRAGLVFLDSLVGVSPQSASLHAPWCGEFRPADHALLMPGVTGLAELLLLPLRRGTQLVGIYCLGSARARPWLAGLEPRWLNHLAAVLSASLERLFDRARLLRSGMTDPLTGWNSRRYLRARLAEEIARCQRQGTSAACALIDIDRLQQVNEQYGFPAGDRVLREAGQRIESETRASDTFAHLGSDEFAVFLPQTEAALAVPLVRRILRAMRAARFELAPGVAREVSVSVGIAGIDGGMPALDRKAVADQLLAEAEGAAHRAKQRGGDCYELSSAAATSATETGARPRPR